MRIKDRLLDFAEWESETYGIRGLGPSSRQHRVSKYLLEKALPNNAHDLSPEETCICPRTSIDKGCPLHGDWKEKMDAAGLKGAAAGRKLSKEFRANNGCTICGCNDTMHAVSCKCQCHNNK